MKKLLVSLLLISVLLAACEPIDSSYTPITPIPFFASETPPPFIVPVTDTPVFIQPVTDTPIVVPFVTDTPVVATELPVVVPVDRWWEVYFTDTLAINNSEILTGSIEEKLIEFINGAN